MVPGRHVLAGVASLLVASLLTAGSLTAGAAPAAGSAQADGSALATAGALAASTQRAVPKSQRIAATTATLKAIQSEIASGKPLQTNFPNPTAAEDILDYGVGSLWQKGIDGSGVTVAYIVTNPDPGLQASMDQYDTAMHLPPAHITSRALPVAAQKNAPCLVECDPGEDRLDAESIHSMAPYANILYVHPSVPETVGMQGWPQVAEAIKDIADRHLADVISVSLGDGEKNFSADPSDPGVSATAAVHSLDPALLDAAAHSIPVSFAAGDCGPTAPPVLGDTGQCTPAIGITAGHPADSPWVTAVGGTVPDPGIATRMGRVQPDPLWTAQLGEGDAGGAGVSDIYPKPSWQQGIAALDNVTGRAFPDISMDASDGTSQASPTFAGILALATQQHGAHLGTVNPALAAIGPRGSAAGIVDVPAGYSNTAYGVPGYATRAGYDLASGWGTIYAPRFVPALIAQISKQHGASLPSRQAASLLRQLQSAATISATKVTAGQRVTVTGSGFIPGRTPNGTKIRDGFGVSPPLRGQYGVNNGPYASKSSAVPGQTWDKVTARLTGFLIRPRSLKVTGPDRNGTVTVSVSTAGLPSGTYHVTIWGMVLSQTVNFEIPASNAIAVAARGGAGQRGKVTVALARQAAG